MKYDREVLLEAAYGETGAQELGHPPMGKKRDLQDAVGDVELFGPRAKPAFERWPAMRHGHQSDCEAGLLEPLHRREQRKRAFGFPELPVDAEIGKLAPKPSPKHF